MPPLKLTLACWDYDRAKVSGKQGFVYETSCILGHRLCKMDEYISKELTSISSI
jgi:hypothetical protein